MTPAALGPAPTAAELHLIYVLLDSNLPTGGFVSSSGLESYVKHGYLLTPPSYSSTHSRSTHSDKGGPLKASNGIMNFSLAEIENYTSTTSPFVADAWRVVNAAIRGVCHCASSSSLAQGSGTSGKGKERAMDQIQPPARVEARVQTAVEAIRQLDEYHEATLLSHVSRRSSKAQGVAMLTLYSRGLSRPSASSMPLDWDDGELDEATTEREEIGESVIGAYKRLVRRGEVAGHLATCWGVITAALGIPLERSLHIHLFLHARSLLSSSVRLNVLGPYASSQLLLHPFQQIIQTVLLKYPDPRTGILSCECRSDEEMTDLWAWAEDVHGPATTWPLGEILTARHDLQHSRIFNS